MNRTLHHRPLGEVVEVASGQVDPTIPPYNQMPHVGGDNIESVTGRIFGVKTASELSLISGKYAFRAGEILYSKIRPALNKVTIPTFDGICSADIYPLRVNPSIADSRYLVYVFRSREFLAYTEAHSSRTNIPKVNRESLLNYEVALPPLPEQRRIADVLDRAESLRAKRRDALAKLDTLTQAIFVDMFGDPVTNPKGWPSSAFVEVVEEFRYGTSNKSQTHGKPALRIPNVVGGVIDYGELKLVPVDDAEFLRLRLRDGDLLFVRTNGNPDFVGRCAVFDSRLVQSSGFPAEDFIYASYLIRARLASDAVSPVFLREFLLGSAGRRELRQRSSTSAGQFNINTENLGSILIPIPPLPLQQEFARRVEAVEQLRSAHRASLVQLDALFASLQHRAFRGEL